MATIATLAGVVVAANVASAADPNTGTVASNGTIDVKLKDALAGGNSVVTLEVATGTLTSSLTVGGACTVTIAQP